MRAIVTSGKSRKNSEKSYLIRDYLNKCKDIPLALIAIYQQLISPFLPPSCRFHPTCSTYARHAINKYGVIRGGVLALIRISKCQPFHSGGYDPLL
ncbi:MAG: membrane protein insertion efficiency factor YidD [Desulfobacteraceae bacterium]|nr:membrane protein insertion efficiency factor YidD [Desulfobacteraceae bacterium]